MKKLVVLFVAVGGLTLGTTLHANLIGLDYADDGDGALTCSYYWNLAEELTTTGNQYSAPGHMVGTLYADTPEDPTLIIRNILDNDTDFTWYSYSIAVSLNKSFVLSDAIAYGPADWTSYITQPVFNSGSGLYVGQVSFNAGTPIQIGETFDFGYKMVFSGAVQYSFVQELAPSVEPVPEPSSWALMLFGMGALMIIRRLSASRA